jgi:hypothetical protein
LKKTPLMTPVIPMKKPSIPDRINSVEAMP